MVYCSKCGTKNVDIANYCHNCGARILRDETQLFEKRVTEFAEDIGRAAHEFGVKAGNFAKHIHEEIMKDDTQPSHKQTKREKADDRPEPKKSEDVPKKLKKVGTKPSKPEFEFCMHCGGKLAGKPEKCAKCGKKIDY